MIVDDDKFVVKLPMKAAGMVVIKSFWLRTGTPWSLSCMSLTSCSSLSKTAGRWEMPLDEDDAPEDEEHDESTMTPEFEALKETPDKEEE